MPGKVVARGLVDSLLLLQRCGWTCICSSWRPRLPGFMPAAPPFDRRGPHRVLRVHQRICLTRPVLVQVRSLTRPRGWSRDTQRQFPKAVREFSPHESLHQHSNYLQAFSPFGLHHWAAARWSTSRWHRSGHGRKPPRFRSRSSCAHRSGELTCASALHRLLTAAGLVTPCSI